MSNDEESENNKKAPADKSKRKPKTLSSYKEEGKSGKDSPTLNAFYKKLDTKKDKSSQS
jgi:hypothetical protein